MLDGLEVDKREVYSPSYPPKKEPFVDTMNGSFFRKAPGVLEIKALGAFDILGVAEIGWSYFFR